MNSQAHAKMVKARAGLILDEPFWGTLALKLKLKEDSTHNSAWVNGVTLGYSPDFVNNLPIKQLKGLIAHEVAHCMFQHHTRRQHRNPKGWNVAGDYVINDLLEACGFQMPEGGLSGHGKYKDMSTEHVYSLLPEDNSNSNGQDGNGKNDSPPGEVRDCPAKSEADIAEQQRDWKVATAQAAQAAKMQGKLPGAVEELVEEMNESKVDWKAMLRRFVQTATAKDDYTWSKPNRRHIGRGLYLPALHGYKTGKIVVAIDTSGSVSSEELKQFLGEINAIVEDVRPEELITLETDTKVNDVKRWTEQDLPIRMSYKGRGGTLFEPSFDWVKENNELPECFIYLTDMGANDFPDPPPDYPVLWISTMKNHDHNPFGEYVDIE